SFISVVVFLPALTLILYKWIDKTKHRPFLPSKYNIGTFIMKLRIPVLVLIAILIVPAFLAQGQTDFLMEMVGMQKAAELGRMKIKLKLYLINIPQWFC